jgi:NAD-dependent SIR2 family protein deacetylase
MSDATPTNPQGRYDSGTDAGPAQYAGATDDPGRDNPAGNAATDPHGEVLTLVCETCGKDYFFDNTQPEPGMTCEKCGGTVFRSFHASVGDEAADDFRDSTERDLDPDDAEGDVMPGDVMDLNNI